MKAKYRVQGPLITCYPDQLRPPPRPAGMTRAHAPGEPVPWGLGEGVGGPRTWVGDRRTAPGVVGRGPEDRPTLFPHTCPPISRSHLSIRARLARGFLR